MVLRTVGRSDSPSDSVLVARFLAGRDQAAFACLVERHRPRVLAVCRRVLRHHHDAEDAAQATFLVLARKAPLLRSSDALAGWLYKVAYHLAVKLRVASERWRQLHRVPPPEKPTPAVDENSSDDLCRVIEAELGRLPDHYRVPLLLCGLAGLSREQAAAQLGWTPGTLKMQLERGRQLLRARLARR